MRGEFETPEALAEEIDRQILKNYHLHSSNLNRCRSWRRHQCGRAGRI